MILSEAKEHRGGVKATIVGVDHPTPIAHRAAGADRPSPSRGGSMILSEAKEHRGGVKATIVGVDHPTPIAPRSARRDRPSPSRGGLAQPLPRRLFNSLD